MDLSSVITAQENPNTFVYGVSYGTYLVERLMQLEGQDTSSTRRGKNNTMIQGYILDGVVSQSGNAKGELMTFASWDADVHSIGEAFLKLCGDDGFCKTKLTSDPVKFLQTLYANIREQVERNDLNDCIHSLRFNFGDSLDPESTSAALRQVLGLLIQSQKLRVLIAVRRSFLSLYERLRDETFLPIST
jgi:hypothetical protein